MSTVHGNRIVELLGRARTSALIVAPFIKDHAVTRLLAAVREDVVDLTCVTRWIPAEVAAGVSDLEVLERVRKRNGRLLLHPWLHAKLYRADRHCLVGSANVTGRALGWTAPGNLELLIETDSDCADIVQFERHLLSEAIPADEQIRNAVRTAADALGSANAIPSRDADNAPIAVSLQRWLPACPTPDRLWNIYANSEPWRMVDSSAAAARTDLFALDVPPGLSRPSFERYVSVVLGGLPLIQEIDRRTQSSVSNAEGETIMRELTTGVSVAYTPSEMWEIVKSWLEYFRPATYRRVPTDELWTKGRKL